MISETRHALLSHKKGKLMSEPYLGEIRMFGGNFAPKGWALCNGQLLSIAQNSALFSILGTTYGGDGINTFALPDLRGRTPMNWGQGPGLTARVIGEQSGQESVTLLTTQMPTHNHLVATNSSESTSGRPANGFLGTSGAALYDAASDGSTLNVNAISSAGGNQPHSNMQPYLAVSFIIALNGIFPSRN